MLTYTGRVPKHLQIWCHDQDPIFVRQCTRSHLCAQFQEDATSPLSVVNIMEEVNNQYFPHDLNDGIIFKSEVCSMHHGKHTVPITIWIHDWYYMEFDYNQLPATHTNPT